VRVFTRYDLREKEGVPTRRERNELLGYDSPKFEIPEAGFYLWEWFIEINSSVSRIDFNGNYCNIPPSEFLAWSQLTRNNLFPEEYDILRSMDDVFCKELNLDLKAKREREDEERRRKMETSKSRIGRR
jgi:hypothetical protein